ncbi:hypothetical protein B0H14DRAFT_3116740 [Mycena olivaceomarginata]|nr:hypothetical protein B0H14DRAFT_3116740 [Mycena olivaceomarginata]
MDGLGKAGCPGDGKTNISATFKTLVKTHSGLSASSLAVVNSPADANASTRYLIPIIASQSKHLQTARIPIFGLELDLVNLRSEEYTDNSRIPMAIAFGIPLQDALRKDIMINTLFYNIHTREVEDCTEKGIEDLKSGTIRTPLLPRETFLDDPSREEEPIQPSPTRSIQMIDDLSLYNAIFNMVPLEIKGSLSGPIAPSTSSVKAACVLRSILSPSGSALENLTSVHPALVSSAKDDPGAMAHLYLAAVLLPHFGISYRHNKRTYAAVQCAVREMLELGTQNHFLNGIPLLFKAAEFFEKNPDLNRFVFIDIFYPTAPAHPYAGLFLRGKDLHHPSSNARWQLIDRYNTFVAHIEELELTNIGAEKPLLNAILGASRPGAWTGAVLARVMEWQLQDPKGTADNCTTWLKEEQSAGRTDIDSEPASKRARTQR